MKDKDGKVIKGDVKRWIDGAELEFWKKWEEDVQRMWAEEGRLLRERIKEMENEQKARKIEEKRVRENKL